MTEENRKRLAAFVIARRVELDMLTTKALAERAELSPRMLGDVENGRRENFSPGAKAQIERALHWRIGSIDAVHAGGVPTALELGYDHPPARWKLSEDSIEYRQRVESARALLEFAIDADAVDNQASSVDLDSTDVEHIKSQVQRLLVDVDRLTQRIHDEATGATDDLNLLRELKNDILRRRRLERLGRRDTSDDLLTEYFRFLENEDRAGLEGDELHRRFFERMAAIRSSDQPKGSDRIHGVDTVMGSVGNGGEQDTVDGL